MWAAKVTTVGNSLGIVLPRELLARLRVSKGDALFLLESPMGIEMTPYDPAFVAQLEAVEQIAREERDVIRQIAIAERQGPLPRSAADAPPARATAAPGEEAADVAPDHD